MAVLSALAGIVVFAGLAGSASAAEVHVYSHSFGSGLSLTAQSGIAVSEESGEVYIADTKNNRIAKFTAANTPDGALTGITSPSFLAIDNSTGSAGDIYVVEGEGTISKRDPAGALVTTWGAGGHMSTTEEILGIAVDAAGNLWILTGHLGTPDPRGPAFGFVGTTITGKELDPSGAPLRSWTRALDAATVGEPAGTTVNSSDAITVSYGSPISGEHNGFALIGPTGTEAGNMPAHLAGAVAFDPANDDLYGGNLESTPYLYRFSAGLQELEKFGGKHEGTRVGSPVKDGLKSIASIAAAESGRVYVVDSVAKDVAVYDLEEVEPPSLTIEPPTSIIQTSAHVVGHINPIAPTGSPPSHDVAWHFQCTPACPGYEGYIEVELDGSERTVEATIGNLVAGTEYSVRLVGENRGGRSETGSQPFTTEPAAPSVTDAAASEVFRGEATFGAGINPNGAVTTYHFEYMTKVAFEAEGFEGVQTSRTPESEPLASIAVVNQVSVRVTGLEPGTDYVYRAAATNAVGSTEGNEIFFRSQVGPNPFQTDCPNQLLRTGPGGLLPDCRAYELVSPTEKNGNLVEPYEANLQAAANGSSVEWYTGLAAAGIPAPGGAHQDPAFYLSTLAGANWNSQRLLPPEQLGELAHLVGLTEDGRYAVIETAIGRGGIEPALYLLDTSTQAFTTIVPPQQGQQVPNRAFALDGASADDSMFFFESGLHLTVNARPEKDNLYMWDRATGEVSLAGALPGSKNEAPPGGSFGGAYKWWEGSAESLAEGGAEAGQYVGAVNAISESGDSVYFTAGESGQLYRRQGLTGIKPTTVRVSVANTGVSDPNGQQAAAFQEATPDGTEAFFLSSGKLTLNANTGPSDEGTDLYRYDAEAKKLVDVTPDAAGAGARVQGLLGVAKDGDAGYLVAKGVLAGGGVAGDSNVYHFEEKGEVFVFRFVADLSTPANPAEYPKDWSPLSTSAKTARVSGDGGTLLFMSTRPLDGSPVAHCIYGDCMGLYRYSMAEESLGCVSCNPTGEGPAVIGAELAAGVAPTILPENVPIYGTLPRNLSAAGTRVFFQSAEGLLPEDVNGTVPRQNCTNTASCTDVYEWEAVGTGSCKSPNQAGGCLYLLSTGESDQSSYFVNASAEGESTFLVTSSQLVPVDEDHLADLYDARVEGGLESQHVAASASCGSSEACTRTVAPPGLAAAPSSQSFEGSGNVEPRPCKKGLVRKHGKCVKKAKHHKKPSHKNRGRSSHRKHSGRGK